jgi:hypothetical protein
MIMHSDHYRPMTKHSDHYDIRLFDNLSEHLTWLAVGIIGVAVPVFLFYVL